MGFFRSILNILINPKNFNMNHGKKSNDNVHHFETCLLFYFSYLFFKLSHYVLFVFLIAAAVLLNYA